MSKRKRTPLDPANPDDPRHGTENGYSNLDCRCVPCTEAHRIAHAAMMDSHPEFRSTQSARRRAKRVGPDRSPIPYDVAQLLERNAALGTVDPQNLREWQYAADIAHCALVVDAAVQYGLVTIDGITLHLDRAQELVDKAAEHGIAPAPSKDTLGGFLLAMIGGVE